jgi:hypothetical protein
LTCSIAEPQTEQSKMDGSALLQLGYISVVGAQKEAKAKRGFLNRPFQRTVSRREKQNVGPLFPEDSRQLKLFSARPPV